MKQVRRQERHDDTPSVIGYTRQGRPVWSIAGGADDGDPNDDDQDDDEDEIDSRAQSKIRKANNEARNLRRRVKDLEGELEQAAGKLREFEDADKSDQDKINEKLTAAEKRAEQAEIKAMRLEVAADKGLTPAQAKRLTGTSLEEMQEDADELLSLFSTGSGSDGGQSQEGDAGSQEDREDSRGARAPRRPAERLPAGTPSDADDSFDPKKVADEIMR